MGTTGTIILLTRPRAASERLAETLGTGTEIVIAPVVRITPVDAVPGLDGVNGLILTSANAAERLSDVPDGLRAYCVGDRTAAIAGEKGCIAISAGGDADALVGRVLSDRPSGQLLHLRGARTRGDVADRLAAAGLKVSSAVIYRQEAQPLDKNAEKRLSQAVKIVAPVYSPMSAAALSDCWPARAYPPHVVAISQAAADAWSGPAARYTIAARPDGAAMLAAIRASVEADGPCS